MLPSPQSESRAAANLFAALLLSLFLAVASSQAQAESTYPGCPPASLPPPPPPRLELPPPPAGQFPVMPPVLPWQPPPAIGTLATDLTHSSLCPSSSQQAAGSALSGLGQLSERDFPGSRALAGSADGIVFRFRDGAQFVRTSPYSVDLKSGEILISVSGPSHFALVKTFAGEISLAANAVALVRQEGEQVRILNLDGLGKKLIFRLNQGPFAGRHDLVFALAPGYEIVASANILKRHDLRPADGLARRNFSVFEQGLVAVSEFSLESVLTASSIIATMNQKESGARDKRILADMSKMAAVLNYMNGAQGFSVEKSPLPAEKLCAAGNLSLAAKASVQAAGGLLVAGNRQVGAAEGRELQN